jgi:hypothetical protein
MVIISNSWAQHFRSITVNNNANKNEGFHRRLSPTMTLAKRVKAFTKEVNSTVFLIGTCGTVLPMHSWSKFGRMCSHPNFIRASLIGTSPRASPVIINRGIAVACSTITIIKAT